MQYSRWGGRHDAPMVSKLGFGTTRFPPSDLHDSEGIDCCVRLVQRAMENGINYFDVAPNYSYGYAEKILGLAFEQRRKEKYTFIAAKTGLLIDDRTADDILRRIDASLRLMKVESIDFYHIWSVMNLEEYQVVMQKGGLYEGLRRAKELGLVKHICISLHCDPSSALKIIEDSCFEGITISMNAINFRQWLPVVQAARARNMGVATMNSLGGGVIPRYSRLFEALDDTSDSVAVKALRFLSGIPGINTLLSGMPTLREIDENCSAFESPCSMVPREFHLTTTETLCSGCGYCTPCTQGISIPACMQAYNHKILVESSGEAVDGRTLTNGIFTGLRANGVNFPEIPQCVSCHVCERRCTQKIDISKRLQILKKMGDKYHYSLSGMREKLSKTEQICETSQHIAVWPSGDCTTRLFDFWDNKEIEGKCEYFNSSPALWGKPFRGKCIRKPEELDALNVDMVLITHYTLRDEIYKSLRDIVSSNIRIIRFYNDDDIDWFNRAAEK